MPPQLYSTATRQLDFPRGRTSPVLRTKRRNVESNQLHHRPKLAGFSSLIFCASKGWYSSSKHAKAFPSWLWNQTDEATYWNHLFIWQIALEWVSASSRRRSPHEQWMKENVASYFKNRKWDNGRDKLIAYWDNCGSHGEKCSLDGVFIVSPCLSPNVVNPCSRFSLQPSNSCSLRPHGRDHRELLS